MSIKTTLIAAFIAVYGSLGAQTVLPKSISPGNSIEFIPNKGQLADVNGKSRPDILYLSHVGDVELYLRNKGLSYIISTLQNPKFKPGYVDDDPPGVEIGESHSHLLKLRNEPFKTCRIDMDFLDAASPLTQNISPTDGYLNYYYPQCPQGILKVKAYENIVYENIYPGIDVSYKGTLSNGFKYDIIVNQGGDAGKIKMKYTGTENVEIADGKLLFTAFTGKMEEHIPKIYQDINGKEINVDGKYILLHKGKDSAEGTVVGIQIGNYNKAYPLIIDPWWASYCGGSSDDEAYACALDNLGNTLAAGYAVSNNFPVSTGAFQTSLVGGMDCFVIKFNSNGQRLWATYYGGSASDAAYGIATDANNNVAITGNTNSSNFPVSTGAFQSTYGGGIGFGDAFVVKFDPNGVRLFGTYCGGSSDDQGNSITFDSPGNVIITGGTKSSNFPVTPGAYQTTYGGGLGSCSVLIIGNLEGGDAFVEKFDPGGNRLWGTYLGGAYCDAGYGVGTDSKGNIAIGGTTSSTNFPVTTGAFQTTPDEGFVSEFDPTGILLWSTYYGGYVNGCAVDKSGNVIAGGYSGDMTSTPGVYQTAKTSGWGFAVKFNSKGNRVWATFNNTVTSEAGDYAMSVDDGNNVYLEDDEEPPSNSSFACGFELVPTNHRECLYVLKLDSNAHYACSTYLSGTKYDEHEYACGNFAAKNGRMAIAGFTSGGIPTTSGVFQTTYPGGAYAPYVMNLCSFSCGDTVPPTFTVSSIIVKSDSCLGYVSFSAHGSAPCDSAGGTFLWSFPGGNPSSATGPYVSGVLYTAAGTYTVTLKYIACSVDSITQVITIKSGFHDSLSVINPSNCHQKGQATVYPSDGVAPYTYSWSNGTTNQTDTGLGAGTYTCVVKAYNGCADTIRFVIKNPVSPGFILKPLADTGFCVGGNVTLSVSGGSNFLWAPSTGLSCTSCTNPIASPTITTIYTLTGMDSVGCPDSAKITVFVDSFPSFSLTTIPTGCGGYTEIEGIPATSSIDYTWTWSPTSSIIYNGGYIIEVSPTVTTTYTATLNNGFCSSSDTVTVSPVSNTFPLSIEAIPDTVCQGALINLIATSSVTMLYWYWYPANGLSCTSCYDPSLNTSLITLTSTTYTVGLESEDSAGCIAYDTVTLHIIPSHVNTENIKICKGSSTILTAHSTTTYLWNTGATTSSITVNPLVTTTYYAIIDSGGCNDSIFYEVVIDPGPPINVTSPADTVCPGSTTPVIALGTGVVSWAWLPNTGLTCYSCHNPIATVNSQITYTVTAIDSTGCISRDSITLYTVPTHSVAQGHLLCKGSSIVLSVSDGNAWQWSTGATTSSITVSPVDTTTYYSVVTYNGGCTDTIFQTVNVHTGPAIAVSLAPDTVCLGSSSSFSAGGSLVTAWSWTPALGLTCNNCPNPTATPTATTTYKVTGYDSLGCGTTDSITVYLKPLPVAAIIASKDTVCAGDSVLLIGGGGGTYLWSTSQKTDSIYVILSSSKTYTLTVTKNGCTDTVTKTIQIYVPGTASMSISKDTICPGDTVILSVNGGTSYKWSNSSTSSSIIVSPGITLSYSVIVNGKCFIDTIIKTIHVLPTPIALITGNLNACKGKNDTLYGSGGITYLWSNGSTNTTVIINIAKDTTLTLKVFNGTCYADTSVNLIVSPSPTVTITSSPKICPGDTISLTASGGGSYYWSTGSRDSTITVTPTATTRYSVIVTNSLGCTTGASTTVNIIAPQLYACCDTSIIIGSSVVLFADSSYTYKWYPSSGLSCDSCPSVTVNPTVTTTYTVIGTDKSGCEVARIITITVEPPCNDYFIPNVFTPNGDGINDEFVIKTEDLLSYSIVIYDRWGKEMYKSSNPLVYWNGNTEGGAKASDGVYYYIITSICGNKAYKKDGYVQLIR